MAAVSTIWHLACLDLFAGMEEAELVRALGSNAELLKVSKRRTVEVEERGVMAWGLSEGLAKFCRTSRSGRRVVDTLLRAGAIFGGMEVSGPKRQCSIETITD